MRIIWTAPALSDLSALRAFIARDDPGAAALQVDVIVSAVAALVDFPAKGRKGRRKRTRELVVTGTPYIVPYRVRRDSIEILRVMHGRRRWPDAL